MSHFGRDAKRLLVGLAAGLALGSASAQAVAGLSVFPEVPVTQVDMRAVPANNSPVLAVDPTERRFVVLANRLDAPDFGCALYLSGDGGRGWAPARPVPKLPAGAQKCYAPEVAFDRRGVLYYLFVGLHGKTNTPMGVFITNSDDRGLTFSAPRKVLGPNSFQVRMAIDQDHGPKGRIHIVWLKVGADPSFGGLPAEPNPIMAKYSDDGGGSFSSPVRVSDRDRPRAVAPAVALGPKGDVYVLYYDLKDDARDYQGLTGPAWEGDWSLVLGRSGKGGGRFSQGVVVDGGVVPPERVMLIFTMPPPSLAAGPDGRLYAAWHDARNGDWDVFVRGSADGGRSWVSPKRANDDPLRNGAHQYQPRLGVAPSGRVDVAFYDRRGDPANLKNDVYFTSSFSSASGSTRNVRLTRDASDSRFGQIYANASAAGLVEFGSRIGLLSSDSQALAAWTDTRNSIAQAQQDIFSTKVGFRKDGQLRHKAA